MTVDVLAAARHAARAELCWRDAQGVLRAIAFPPLVVDGDVVAALPFDRSTQAADLHGATAGLLTLSDSRMAWRGWQPCALPVRVAIEADLDGAWTWTGALDQLVRKHTPSQQLLDTAIQRREHWWYVPRWVVRMRPAGAPAPLARRGPADAVLYDDLGDELRAATVAVEDWDAAEVAVTPLAASSGGMDGSGTAALLFAHDFSIPDHERATELWVRGRREGRRVIVARRAGALELEALGGVVRRLRRHRRLERACRAALAEHERAVRAGPERA